MTKIQTSKPFSFIQSRCMQALYVSSHTSPPRVPTRPSFHSVCNKTAPLLLTLFMITIVIKHLNQKEMITLKNIWPLQILSLLCLCCCFTTLWLVEAEEAWGSNLVVKKDDRRKVLETEFGDISAVEIGDGARFNGSFNLQFFTLEPNALFLPVMLHSEMLLYCQSGSGDLTWMGPGKKSTTLSLSRGDVYMLRQGSVFFIRSNLGADQRERLRITALFANSNEDLHFRFSSMGPYSSIADLVRGFDSSVLQAAFQVPEEVIQTIKSAAKQPLIIQDVSSQPEEGQSWDWEGRFMRVFMSLEVAKMENKKKKHKESRTFNVYTADRDFENCNGWSLTVTSKDLEVLKESDVGAFYVNLTKGAMMAPHWNPMASEIAFVVAGQGMVRIVCSSSEGNQSGCENQSFKVEEGDVFMVPRFHPMSQTSFNNDSFVFMGFSTAGKRNYPQYLVGKQSVFQVIDKDVLAAAFNVDNETVVQLSGPQEEALIVDCTSCAEEQFSAWQEEVDRSRQEEERKKREEEEARKREEEEDARKRERKRQEEEAAREEEERRQREEEARERDRKRQEEEAAREEEERRQREEQAQREEEERRQSEEQAQHEEEERRQREEQAKRQEEERAEKERRQREEEARRQKEEEGRGGGGESEEEAARRQEEERERREREEQHGGGGEEPEQEGPARTPEERQPRKPARRQRHQPQEEEKGGQGESEGEAAMRQEEERIRSERKQMERGRSVEPPIILVDNLDKVMDVLF